MARDHTPRDTEERFPVVTTLLGAKRFLNKTRSGYTYGSRIVSHVVTKHGVHIIRRDLGVYRTKGTYKVSGGAYEHETKAKGRVFDTADEAIAHAFEREAFAASEHNAAAALIGRTVTVKISPAYGARRVVVEGMVISANVWDHLGGAHTGFVTVDANVGDRVVSTYYHHSVFTSEA